MANGRLGIGFIGSGFNARFHVQAFAAVRDADVLGVFSPTAKHAASMAELARTVDVGPTRPYASIAQMVADPAIDAIWLSGPNQARIGLTAGRSYCHRIAGRPLPSCSKRIRSP